MKHKKVWIPFDLDRLTSEMLTVITNYLLSLKNIIIASFLISFDIPIYIIRQMIEVLSEDDFISKLSDQNPPVTIKKRQR